ncbi:type II toxin-antitoxin system RelB/DinJ family antitoxin [Lentilactobacillus sp. IMAU92037]|uniref:type II toxin-antitoxin system RelB/DinJ family antitoxin n=1 Tax=Lentilactobacillus TaxID=2767893 RepID=UPI001C262686|nr:MULTISPECIES: type II toxin-antitoxin system RelB/DinJ family antitoxin [Lentilactobacillus]MBU9789170.1 type II toxin-antitoxin system RelB/DinJ family antitoxin [Lentilactobacillus dabitei]MBV0929387.1 type II toxin-antitoxin system RelB/DinJ family antitoxin [Lentilactobacillus dabitei]MDM7516583.1 type II toxin-antitoxin system RelB/DinJ family antitoxin [Lentilactobacillus sp. TOM.63]
MPIKSDKKKRIQVMMDQQLSDDVNDILSDLGLNPSILMNALYRRIEAEGKIPFDFSLTDEERATHHLTSTIKSLGIPIIKNKQEAEKFLFGDDDEK